MRGILVYLSVQDGRIKRSSLEALSRAREVGASSDVVVEALILNSNATSLAGEAFRHGASKVYTLVDPIFDTHLNAPLVAGLTTAINVTKPRLFVAASTESIKDVLGSLAIRCGASILPDVASFELSGDDVSCERPVMAAKMMARTKTSHRLVLVSVRSGSYEATPSATEGSAADIVGIGLDMHTSRLEPILREVVSTTSDMVDLSEASVVVAAGRGVRDAEGKALIEELASVTGAAIGASRAVVETDLFPATAQIGQTGKVVSPELYFAIGISGAIQHVAGMSNSRVIVAINKDADAPIFDVATYGLVGDCFKILPILIAELKKVLQ